MASKKGQGTKGVVRRGAGRSEERASRALGVDDEQEALDEEKKWIRIATEFAPEMVVQIRMLVTEMGFSTRADVIRHGIKVLLIGRKIGKEAGGSLRAQIPDGYADLSVLFGLM